MYSYYLVLILIKVSTNFTGKYLRILRIFRILKLIRAIKMKKNLEML